MTDIVHVPLVERLQPADLAALQLARARAELAMKDAEILQLRVFVRYGLSEHDSFDLATGIITRSTPPPVAPPEPQNG